MKWGFWKIFGRSFQGSFACVYEGSTDRTDGNGSISRVGSQNGLHLSQAGANVAQTPPRTDCVPPAQTGAHIPPKLYEAATDMDIYEFDEFMSEERRNRKHRYEENQPDWFPGSSKEQRRPGEPEWVKHG